MGQKEQVELVAAAIAAATLGALAERRDLGGGAQIRDFDLVFPDGRVEPMEVTRHFDRAANETWHRLERSTGAAPMLSRAWTLDVPSQQRSAAGEPQAYGVREFIAVAEPALRRYEEAGYTSFNLGTGAGDPSLADARDVLLRLGVQFGISRELPPGSQGRIAPVAPVGGITGAVSVASAIEQEAGDVGNQQKLRAPDVALRRHLFVVFDPSSGSVYNAVDRGLVGRVPKLPDPITTAWAFARHRVFVTTPPEDWRVHDVREEVMNDPDRWVSS